MAVVTAGTGASAAQALHEQKEDQQESLTLLQKFADYLLHRCMTAVQIIREVDHDGNGTVDLEEFAELCHNVLRLPFTPSEIHDLFVEVDEDHDGSCSSVELQHALEQATQEMEERQFAKSMLGKSGEGDMRQDTKLIALVAHNKMKRSMMAFVAHHRQFFKLAQIVTTGSTGSALEAKLGLKIARKVASGPLGGDQEIGGMITQNLVAGCFFFIDPLSAHPHAADIRALTRICEVHNCPCASNKIMGEALVHAFITSPMHMNLLYKQTGGEDSQVVQDYKSEQKAVIANVAASSATS